ncbi:MAG: VCBS repeat-containing protein [Planctomycetota bacterium]
MIFKRKIVHTLLFILVGYSGALSQSFGPMQKPTVGDTATTQWLAVQQEGLWPLLYQEDILHVYTPLVCETDPVTGLTVVAYAFGDSVYIVDHSGNSLPGWPIDTHSITGGYGASYPVLGDIDGDGDLEVVSYNNKYFAGDYVIAWHLESGGLVNHWPLAFPDDLCDLALSDLDNDGTLEVLVSRRCVDYGEAFVFALNGDGSLFEEWPAMSDSTNSNEDMSSLSSADLDGDGKKEVIISYWEYYNEIDSSPVFIYDYNGNFKWKHIVDGSIQKACVGNIDNDPELEILLLYNFQVDSQYKSGTLILNHDGTIVPGWDPKIWYEAWDLAFADIDLDGKKEIIVSSHSKPYMIVYNHDGTVKWERENVCSLSNLLIADILGDDKPEIIYGCRKSDCLRALNSDGEIVLSLPVLPRSGDNYSNMLWDLDHDGDVELLSFNVDYHLNRNEFCAWDLAFKINTAEPDWPMYRHDARHSGYDPK